MRIACLQFAPQVGDIDNNLSRADAILERVVPQDLDLLVLPELAFTGFNFKSLQHISPYLEPTTAGITASWARATALKHNCLVAVGYPETVDITVKWPASPEYHNSALIVDTAGEVIANYKKAHLYPSEEKWSLEGPDGFFDDAIPGFGNVVMGIGMDINPYKFETSWTAWEFANHVIYQDANLVIIPMAWLMHRDLHARKNPQEPDMETLAYWLSRLEPVIRAEQRGEIIVVFANRCGIEGDTAYTGTSAVLGIDAGEVKVYGVLGCGESELLVIDTDQKPHAKLVSDTISTTMEYNVHSPIISNFEPPTPEEAEFPASIDAILHATTPISPVEPRFSHAYYDTQPPKPQDLLNGLSSSTQVGAGHSASTSVRSSVGSSIQSLKPFSMQSLLSVANQPARGKSPKSSRSRTKEATLPQSQSLSQHNLLELHISTAGSATDPDTAENGNASPSSVSSMTTHAPWGATLSSSQEKVKLKTVESRLNSSPSPRRNGTPSKVAQRRPTPAPQVRTTSRTGRTSRTSRKHENFEEAVPLTSNLTPAPEILIAQITIATPEKTSEIKIKKNPAVERITALQGLSRVGSALAPMDERSPEPRPRSTVW